MRIRSLLSSATLLFFVGTLAYSGGWHKGEFKNLDVEIEYRRFAYTLPNGEPVYYIGSTMEYIVTITNTARRKYKNFQSNSVLHWVGSYSCVRWWKDGSKASFTDGSPLPGNSNSGMHPLDLNAGESRKYRVTYHIPYDLCPGRGEIRVLGRHRNSSGRDEVGQYRIPVGVEIARRP